MGKLTRLKNSSQGLLGALTVVCGFLMMWGGVRTGRDSVTTLSAVMSQAVDIDPMHPSPANNGRIVVAAAQFSSSEQLDDEYLQPTSNLILHRHVEMYQWAETFDPLTGKPMYELGWREGQIDFFSFRETSGHENPLLRIQPVEKKVTSARFGAFDGAPILRSIRKLIPVELSPQMLRDPSLTIEDNMIVVPRDPSTTGASLGDMRVWYEALPQGDYTILTRQVDERSLLGADRSDTLIIRQGIFSADEFGRAEIGATERDTDGLLLLGAIILCLGLFSVLLPFAPQIDLRPRLAVDGKAALFVVCLGVSLVTFVVLWVLGRLG
jgi:hypothetical protein